MILAGMNFGIHFKLLRGDIRPILKDSELKTYLGIFLGAVAIITAALLRKGSYPDAGTALRYTAFNASSILTTTGFVTADYLAWPAFNYSFFPGYITAWLSFSMLLGRLEVYTVLVLFTRSFWKR